MAEATTEGASGASSYRKAIVVAAGLSFVEYSLNTKAGFTAIRLTSTMALETVNNEMLARTWACVSGPEAKNPVFNKKFDSLESFTATFNYANLRFPPGLLATMNAPSPPSIEFFKKLPVDGRDRWGVYAIVLKKPDCIPHLYIGSGTGARRGLLARLRQYDNGTSISKLVRKRLADEYEITYKGILCWLPIPSADDVPRLRLLVIALEATFSFIFWAMQSRKKDYKMGSYCPWPRDSFTYHGLCTHNALFEAIVGDLKLSPEELKVLARIRDERERQYRRLPEVLKRARERKRARMPEVKEREQRRRRERAKLPAVKERTRQYRRWYENLPEEKIKRRERQRRRQRQRRLLREAQKRAQKQNREGDVKQIFLQRPKRRLSLEGKEKELQRLRKRMKLPGAKEKKREQFRKWLKRPGVRRRINQRRRERYQLDPGFNLDMRNRAGQYQKRKFKEKETKRVLKNMKQYEAGQHDVSTLAEGAKYSCAICRYGFRSRSALAKHRATPGHQRRLAIANEFFGSAALNPIDDTAFDRIDGTDLTTISNSPDAQAVAAYKYHCNLCNYWCKTKDYLDHHKKSKGHLIKEAEAGGSPGAAITYAYYCDLCGYSTNIPGSLKSHKKTKAHLAKEAEVRRSTNGNTNADNDANGETEAAVTWKYSCNLCDYSTNLKRNFDAHNKTKAHLVKKAKAYGTANIDANAETNGETDAAVVLKYSCNLCDYSTNRKGDFNVHNKTKAHLVKEAKAYGSANTDANAETNGETDAAVVFKYSCNLCDYSTNRKGDFDVHNKTKGHLVKEAKAANTDANAETNSETDAVVVFKYNCSLCGFSTNLGEEFGRHNATQTHLAREAEATLNATGETDVNADVDADAAAVVFKYNCSLCDFSTDVKKKFGRHNATKAHRAKEAEARLNATGETDVNADVDADAAAVVFKYNCSLCNYSTYESSTLKRHKRSKAHRAKEAEARLNAIGDAEVNAEVNADIDAEAAIVDEYHCSLCNYSCHMKHSMKRHETTKAHLAKEAEARRNNNTGADVDAEAPIVYDFHCSFCDYSTMNKESFEHHKQGKRHLEKEAEARRNEEGDAEASVVYKHNCSVCNYSTNIKPEFERHGRTKAHLAKEAEARHDSDVDADVNAEALVVYKYHCSLCNYSAIEKTALDRHNRTKGHLAKEAEARGSDDEEPEAVVYKHNCNLCGYSTNAIDTFQRHKISRSHLAKEAEARGSDDEEPEAVVYKHHCSLCNYSTNDINCLQQHHRTKGHLAKEAEARGGDENDPEVVVVYKHSCNFCDYSTNDNGSFNRHKKSKAHVEKETIARLIINASLNASSDANAAVEATLQSV
ncbi:hypothetical protein T069G_02673 [Trichoderma breve]|uniref:C2H2-type domain-containing protein n=1 Tax=Trichoderma breve TaxID=2034170 RepID=A0A9W9BG61_9HYPO|nr:hypothetical protein T069G_02673 [Trichoderma breve]KAJ4861719.1 hypothetical protein T069G_02673 [Trichoderma breve]